VRSISLLNKDAVLKPFNVMDNNDVMDYYVQLINVVIACSILFTNIGYIGSISFFLFPFFQVKWQWVEDTIIDAWGSAFELLLSTQILDISFNPESHEGGGEGGGDGGLGGSGGSRGSGGSGGVSGRGEGDGGDGGEGEHLLDDEWNEQGGGGEEEEDEGEEDEEEAEETFLDFQHISVWLVTGKRFDGAHRIVNIRNQGLHHIRQGLG
jgi:hypothetical protein